MSLFGKKEKTSKTVSVMKLNEIIKSLGIISQYKDLDAILDPSL